MSKYKIKFYLDTGHMRGQIEDIIDLVTDYEYTEEKAREIINSERDLKELHEQWLEDKIDTGFEVITEEELVC